MAEPVAPEAEVPVAPPAEPDKDETILDLLKEQSDVIASLKDEIQELKDRPVPTSFKPMATPDLHGGDLRMKAFNKAMDTPGNAASTTKQKLIGTNGVILNENVVRQYPRRFDGGSPVRLIRASTREGSDTTWGDVLDKYEIEGVGVVTKPYWLMKTGQWKWQVKIEGLEVDGYADYELEPA